MKTWWVCIWLTGVLALCGWGLWGNGHAAPRLAYVYATSMEPAIGKYDGFLVWPKATYQVGDIVMYRPTFLHASFITHRIIRVAREGFMTKGDNAPFPDQDSGEPAVTNGQVVGKVLTIRGQPIVLPQLGRVKRWWVGIGVAGLVAVGLLRVRKHGRRNQRASRGARLWNPIITLAVICIVTGMSWMGGSTEPSLSRQQSPTPFLVKNRGVLPVLNVTSGAREVVLMPLAQKEIWITRSVGTVRSINYPLLLPKAWLVPLDRMYPKVLRIGIALISGVGAGMVLQVLVRVRLPRGRRR